MVLPAPQFIRLTDICYNADLSILIGRFAGIGNDGPETPSLIKFVPGVALEDLQCNRQLAKRVADLALDRKGCLLLCTQENLTHLV